MWGYSVADIRISLAQWDQALTTADLSPCAEGGAIYNKALAEIQAALLAAGYNPTVDTPIAYQLAHDLLVDGISAYFVETRRAASFTDGYDPLSGLFSRYRRRLRDIASGERFGEFGQQATRASGVYCRGKIPDYWRGL